MEQEFMNLLTHCTSPQDVIKLLRYLEMNSSSKQAREVLFNALLDNNEIFKKPNVLQELEKVENRSTLEFFNAHLKPLGLEFV